MNVKHVQVYAEYIMLETHTCDPRQIRRREKIFLRIRDQLGETEILGLQLNCQKRLVRRRFAEHRRLRMEGTRKGEKERERVGVACIPNHLVGASLLAVDLIKRSRFRLRKSITVSMANTWGSKGNSLFLWPI